MVLGLRTSVPEESATPRPISFLPFGLPCKNIVNAYREIFALLVFEFKTGRNRLQEYLLKDEKIRGEQDLLQVRCK